MGKLAGGKKKRGLKNASVIKASSTFWKKDRGRCFAVASGKKKLGSRNKGGERKERWAGPEKKKQKKLSIKSRKKKKKMVPCNEKRRGYWFLGQKRKNGARAKFSQRGGGTLQEK